MIALPEYVETCRLCGGQGKRLEWMTVGCGASPVQWPMQCEGCDGNGYAYKGTGKPVAESVVIQIREAIKRA